MEVPYQMFLCLSNCNVLIVTIVIWLNINYISNLLIIQKLILGKL